MTDWQKERTMSARAYKMAIARLGMSQAGAGRYLGVSERTAARFCSGHAVVPTSAALLLRALIATGIKPLVPTWSSVQG